MALLSRTEQERIVVQFERDYGKLVMLKNSGFDQQNQFTQRVEVLAEEIAKVAKPGYFEDDILSHLISMHKSIKPTGIRVFCRQRAQKVA